MRSEEEIKLESEFRRKRLALVDAVWSRKAEIEQKQPGLLQIMTEVSEALGWKPTPLDVLSVMAGLKIQWHAFPGGDPSQFLAIEERVSYLESKVKALCLLLGVEWTPPAERGPTL